MTHKMLPAAGPYMYEQYIAQGWTDEKLIEAGYMAPETSAAALATDDRLRLLIERVERLDEEIKNLRDDRKDVMAEAKAVGYDTKIIGQIIRLRAMKPDDRHEMEILLDTYKSAVGLG